MAWFYHLNGENVGPVETAELRALKAREVISPETLVWTEGMPVWAALGTTPVCIPATPPPMVTVTKLIPMPIPEGKRPESEVHSAPVWLRLVAFLIDGAIWCMAIAVVTGILNFLFIMRHGIDNTVRNDTVWERMLATAVLIFILLGPLLYEILFIGKYGATWGKMAVDLKVVRPDSRRVSYLQSTGRCLAKIGSALILGLGFLTPFLDYPRCRGLHDFLSKTWVVTKS